MSQTQIYWYQNQFLPKDEVRISPEDRGYYFGDGAYEVIRVYHGKLFEADAHYDRLVRTAEAIHMTLPLSKQELLDGLNELVKRNQVQEGTVYLQYTRGIAPRAHSFPQGAEPVLMAYAGDLKRPLAAMENGIRTVTMDDIRWLRCDLKTLNLLANTMAKQHALSQGADDVILHRQGTVTECSASNAAIVKNGRIITHPANHLILHGITRMVMLRLAERLGIPAEERPFTLDELQAADEVFITGTTVEVTPVVSVDGLPVSGGQPGPVTRRLQEAFSEAIRS
ncbi:D-alanine aminotransferase [Paenibacillus mucilaginosus 3016]|uniref:D-alanine aminotransferase n=1 Tax=Paenibacillus mucilaginosus 3016 TaxID=1116391 RepID=H6NA48_9BACL|nr:D-amino-acid transaminase [Paenibacillus mucilaginosus]AFC28892.1 D-alanine aminotransferase [Paenibacillus mucilaginosus 3016]WFA17645.1 D-amino-acid transaminase [Paenibacillus mucilaginosus]